MELQLDLEQRRRHALAQHRRVSGLRAEAEGEIIRRSDYHYTTNAYAVATYFKPSVLLTTLRGLLGEERFMRAYRTFIRDWAYKHPYPYDFFNTFEAVSGQDLAPRRPDGGWRRVDADGLPGRIEPCS